MITLPAVMPLFNDVAEVTLRYVSDIAVERDYASRRHYASHAAVC